MAKLLIKGEKVMLGKTSASFNSLELNFTYHFTPETKGLVDLFLFVLEADSNLNSQEIVFYNNPQSTGHGISYREKLRETTEEKSYQIELHKISDQVQKLVLGLAVNQQLLTEAEAEAVNYQWSFCEKISRQELFQIKEKVSPQADKSILIGEIYQYKEMWKFNTILHPSHLGLMGLVKSLYGVEI